MLLFKRFFFVDTCYDVLFCNTEITSSCTTSVYWDISSNTLGYVIMNSFVFKVPYMFRKFCIVSTMLVAKWFCMVVVVKLEILTTAVICISNCWHNYFINSVFWKTFTVEWAPGWISAVTLTYLVGLWWWRYFLILKGCCVSTFLWCIFVERFGLIKFFLVAREIINSFIDHFRKFLDHWWWVIGLVIDV